MQNKNLKIVIVALAIAALSAFSLFLYVDSNEVIWFLGRLPIIRRFVNHASVDDQIAKYGPVARERLVKVFATKHVDYPPDRVAFVAIKDVRELQVYCASSSGGFRLICRYPILGASGHLGPKLRSGDRQVPEGIYQLKLEPNTPYHLALRINYPNEFDLEHAREEQRSPGGDILIHGTNGSIGCIAMGDPASEDLFVLAHDAKDSSVPLVIAPVDFRSGKLMPQAETDPKWLPELYGSIKLALKQYPAT